MHGRSTIFFLNLWTQNFLTNKKQIYFLHIKKNKMSMNDQENEIQVPLQTEFNKLNISDGDSHPIIINHRNCSYCNKPFSEDLWCKECDPFRMIEGWTSGNPDIDKFIKDTIYNKKYRNGRYLFLEWVPFDRFEDIKQIGEGGFAKV